jgi:hypothetical protein
MSPALLYAQVQAGLPKPNAIEICRGASLDHGPICRGDISSALVGGHYTNTFVNLLEIDLTRPLKGAMSVVGSLRQEPKGAKDRKSSRHTRLRPTLGYLSLLRKVEFLRHPNEIGYVANAQFLHHSAAVNLDGLLDSAQVARNLLVEASCDDVQ